MRKHGLGRRDRNPDGKRAHRRSRRSQPHAEAGPESSVAPLRSRPLHEFRADRRCLDLPRERDGPTMIVKHPGGFHVALRQFQSEQAGRSSLLPSPVEGWARTLTPPRHSALDRVGVCGEKLAGRIKAFRQMPTTWYCITSGQKMLATLPNRRFAPFDHQLVRVCHQRIAAAPGTAEYRGPQVEGLRERSSGGPGVLTPVRGCPTRSPEGFAGRELVGVPRAPGRAVGIDDRSIVECNLHHQAMVRAGQQRTERAGH